MIYAQVDDRVRKQSGLEINDVIQSIGDESVEGLTFARTAEMIQHRERDFQMLKLKVSRIMCKVKFDDSSELDVPRSQLVLLLCPYPFRLRPSLFHLFSPCHSSFSTWAVAG